MTLLAGLFGCGHAAKIPNVAVYRELPFSDAPEAIEVWSLTDDYRIVEHNEWEKMRPFMLMIPPRTWAEIKKGWLSACRRAGSSSSLAYQGCTHEVESVDTFVRDLDNIIKTFMEGR